MYQIDIYNCMTYFYFLSEHLFQSEDSHGVLSGKNEENKRKKIFENQESACLHHKMLKDGWTEKKEFWTKKGEYGTWIGGKGN